MNQQVGIWVTLAVYLVFLIAVGIWTGRKSKSVADFTVGGRKAGAWLSALSYGTAYFSAVMFVGYAGGTGLKYGLWGILAGIGNAVFGSYFAWKVLARRTRDVSARLKLKTMPQFFEMRYGSSAMKIFACVVIFIFMVPYSASVYKGLASVAEVLLGIDYTICMIVIAVLAALLLLFGGYLVQARADFVQGIIMMFGIALLILFVVRSNQVGGFAGVAEYARGEHGFSPMSGSNWVALWATVLMTSFGTWGLPQMIQKYFGIRDDEQAKRGIKISTFFAFLVAGGGYFIGSLCFRYFSADQMKEMGQDYIVPNLLKETGLPTVLLGVVLMLLIAASVSTLCSVTLTASSTLSIDFIRPIAKMQDKAVRTLTKILCVVFIVISYVVANTDTPILDMMSYSWGIISGSFLAPYVLALYYKKLSKGGAWCGILGGFLTAMVPASCKILTLCGSEAPQVVKLAGFGPQFACAAMLVSIILCFVGSAIFHSEKDASSQEFFYKGLVENE
ncbi:MAG: sodium:solute symporter family protein [Clostridia bacterium]|nr:sodium:solute symporter family protein [Clostridia bacterium]